MNWSRLALGLVSALSGSLAVSIPSGTAIHVGGAAIPIREALGAISLYLGGWATRTPGHGPVDEIASK